MLRNSYLRWYAVIIMICCFLLIGCGLSYAADNTINSGAEGLIPDPDVIIKKILGIDEMAKNVCLIDSHQMVNAADLPGRLVAISADRQVPSDLLRYSFRKAGAKIVTQVNPPTTPVQVTRLESGQARTGSLFNWFGASMSKDDIAEMRTIAMPATSMSVDDLDEDKITERFSAVSEDVRKGLGIITDVIPYEVLASICKKVTNNNEAGLWYIRLGKNTYCKQTDELRKYYLVAVYTPLVFYDDIGVTSDVKSTSTSFDPWQLFSSRAEAFSSWLKVQTKIPKIAEFSKEREVGWSDAPESLQPKTEDDNLGGATAVEDKKSGGLTTVIK